MATVTYLLTGLHCGACVKRVTAVLTPLAEGVAVTLDPMQVQLTNPSADFLQLQAAVAQAGKYALMPAEPLRAANLSAPTRAPSIPATVGAAAMSAPDERPWLTTYWPLLLILAFIMGASVLVQVGGLGMAMGDMAGMANMPDMPAMGGWSGVSFHETMRLSMAGFFLVFSFFKLLDVRAFANAYAGYDLLARRWFPWGLMYPFIEMALGIAYLVNFNPFLTNAATAVVMGFSAIGVIRAVLTKSRMQCACLGTVFQLPMSTVTIVEDVGMGLMAVWMLAMP